MRFSFSTMLIGLLTCGACLAEPRTVRFATVVTDAKGTHYDYFPKTITGDAKVDIKFNVLQGPVTFLAAPFDDDQELVGKVVTHTAKTGQSGEIQLRIPAGKGDRIYLLMLADGSELKGLQTLKPAPLVRRLGDYLTATLKTANGGNKSRELGGVVSTSASAANPSPPRMNVYSKQDDFRPQVAAAPEAAAAKPKPQPKWLTQSFDSKDHPVVRYSLKYGAKK